MAVRRILKSSTFTLPSPVFVGADGETPTDATGTPTCAVTREDGTALTAASVSDAAGVGNYAAALTTTHTSRVDVLTVTWTATVAGTTQVHTDAVEVVGALYATIPELRAEPDMADPATYPATLLREVLDEFAELAESYCGRAFVPRYCRDRLDGSGLTSVQLRNPFPTDLIAVTVNGTSQTLTDFDLFDDGELVWSTSSFDRPNSTDGHRNVVVQYVHGYPAVPASLRRAALTYVRRTVKARVAGQTSDVLRESQDGYTVQFSTPDPSKGRPTGMATVDAALNALRGERNGPSGFA